MKLSTAPHRRGRNGHRRRPAHFRRAEFTLPAGHTLALVVLRGTVLVNDAQVAREAQLVLLDREGSDVALEANGDATVLLLAGEPTDEPIVGDGPLVMISGAEIVQAIEDFNGGRFGALAR